MLSKRGIREHSGDKEISGAKAWSDSGDGQESTMGGCFGGLEAKPQHSKILYFFCKNNLTLGLFWCFWNVAYKLAMQKHDD